MAAREERALSNPIIFLDGRRIKIMPNSATHELPYSRSVRAVSAGGNSIDMVYGVNVEDGACTVKFETPNTAEYVELAEAYADPNREPSTIKIVEDTKQFFYDQMSLTTKIEIPRETEGAISFEFMGRYAPLA